jgi:hypothetical protein
VDLIETPRVLGFRQFEAAETPTRWGCNEHPVRNEIGRPRAVLEREN